MEDSDANHPLSPSAPSPTSTGNKQNEIEARPRSPLRNAGPLSPSSPNPSASEKKPKIRFVLKGRSSSKSPIPLTSGKSENERATNRKSSQMGAKSDHESKESSPKNLTSPTNSTPSKPFALKKKILSEWNYTSPDAQLKNPSNLAPKSPSPQVSTSDSALKSDDVKIDDETFVPDPSTKPYDPLTNYLSPRPKFLRYKPNRRPENILLRHREEECIPSPSVSRDCRDVSVYSTAESLLRTEMGANGDSEKLKEEEEDEDEEGVEEMAGIRGRKWGLKWVLLKSLILLAVVVLCTMYISSMNKDEHVSGMRGLKVEYKDFGNNTFRGISLKSVEFGSWVFDMREASVKGMLEMDDSLVAREKGRSLGKTYEWDDHNDENHEIDEVVEKIEYLEDCNRTLSWFGTEGAQNPILESLKDDQAETKVPLIALAFPNQTIEEENIDFDAELEDEAEMVASDDIEVTEEPNSKDGQLINEAEDVVEETEENVAGFKGKVAEFEQKTKNEHLENAQEIVSEEPHRTIQGGNLFDYPKMMVESEPKSEEETGLVVEELIIEVVVEGDISDNVHKRFWLNPKNAVWIVIPSLSLVTWVAALVARFYSKCKKASSKTNSSHVKLNIPLEKSRSRLPPKQPVKTSQIQKTDAQLTSPSVVHSREERVEKASSRILPRVEMLGELVVGGEFRRSKIQEIEERIKSFSGQTRAAKMAYSTPAPSRSQISYSEYSDAESILYESFVSQDKTAKRQDSKEEPSKMTPTPLRRSSRLRNKGVTSL